MLKMIKNGNVITTNEVVLFIAVREYVVIF